VVKTKHGIKIDREQTGWPRAETQGKKTRLSVNVRKSLRHPGIVAMAERLSMIR
jgi:hypothetical protein